MTTKVPLAQQRVRVVVAVHAQHAVEIGISHDWCAVAKYIAQRDGIEGLFVLAPAGIAEEALVIELHALPADSGAEPLARISNIRLIYFGGPGVDHERISRLTVGAAVVVLIEQRLHVLSVGIQLPVWCKHPAVAKTQAQGICLRALRECIVVDLFVAIAQFEHRPAP